MASGVALSGEELDTPVVCWGIRIALADLFRVLLGLFYLFVLHWAIWLHLFTDF